MDVCNFRHRFKFKDYFIETNKICNVFFLKKAALLIYPEMSLPFVWNACFFEFTL